MKTLLQGVNEVLKKIGVIDSDLSTLTSGGKQISINRTIQAWNEAIEQLYSVARMSMPNEQAEDTITLANGTRAYALASDLVQLYYPLLDETNGQYLEEYQPGYFDLVSRQPIPANETGLPIFACIRPTDGYLFIDKDPTTDYAGRIYKYRYDKDISLSILTDTFPFSDTVFRAMVPVVSELVRLYNQDKYAGELSSINYGRAAKLLTQKQERRSWLPSSYPSNPSDPFNATEN